MTVTATSGEWPLLERWQLFERIAAAADGCVLVGPAGVGKSTAARLAFGGADVPIVAGVLGLAGIPLGALNMAEMTSPLPVVGSVAHVDADDLVTHVRAWLRHFREGSRAVIVDDPAALDPESIAVLVDEMRWGLRVVITRRPDQDLPEAMAEVVTTRALPTIEIDPFDASMVGLAIESALGREPSAATVEQLSALSGGNPMLLREIVRDLTDRDAWNVEVGALALRADADPSARLAELLLARFPIDPDAQAFLALVATAGTLPEDLARVLATSAIIDELQRAGWLVVGEAVAMAHPLLTQVVSERVPASDVEHLLRGALSRIDAVDELSPGSRLRCLRWALTCGATVSASELRWGRGEAARRFDTELAWLIADRLSQTEPTLDTTLELVLALAQAERFDEVIVVLLAARDRAHGRDEIVEIARFLLRFAGPLARLKRWGDPPVGVDGETARWADAALATTAFADLLAAFDALAAGGLDEARAHAVAVRAAGLDEVSADADEVTMLAALYAGDEDDALAAFDRLGDRLGDVTHRHPKSVVIDAAASSLLMLAGRFEQAYDFDHHVWQTARAQHDIERVREMSGHLGMTGLFVGRIDEATAAFVRHRSYPAAPNSLRTMYTAGLAQCHALGGRLIEAERVLVEAERERGVVSPMMLADYENLAGMVAHLLGHGDEGEARMRRALELALEGRNSRGQLMALHGLTRQGRVTDVDVALADSLRARGGPAAPEFTVGVLAMVPAIHAGDPMAMIEAAGHFARTGFALGAAEAYAAAGRALPDRSAPTFARVRRELDGWLARCPGLCGQTVLVDRGVDALTDREHQIASLAAGGIANQIIAERLGISLRTVENCLHRAFTKVAVSSRTELAAAMGGVT